MINVMHPCLIKVLISLKKKKNTFDLFHIYGQYITWIELWELCNSFDEFTKCNSKE